jgi:hypothetical protein
MKAAGKIARQRKAGANLPPVYILFLTGNDDKIPHFFEETGLNDPYLVIPALEWFKMLKGPSAPTIVMQNNAKTVAFWDSAEFDENEFRATVEKNMK